MKRLPELTRNTPKTYPELPRTIADSLGDELGNRFAVDWVTNPDRVMVTTPNETECVTT